MAAAVMSDAAISVGRKKEHLVLEGVRAQRPPMAEDDGLSAAPVLVVQLDGFGIFFTDSNVWHIDRPFCVCVNCGQKITKCKNHTDSQIKNDEKIRQLS